MENAIKTLFQSEEGIKNIYVRQTDRTEEIEKKIVEALEEKLGKEKAVELMDEYQESVILHDEACLYQIFEKGFMFGFDMADRIYSRKRHSQ